MSESVYKMECGCVLGVDLSHDWVDETNSVDNVNVEAYCKEHDPRNIAALKARVSELEGWKEDVDLTLKWMKEYFEEKHAEKIKYPEYVEFHHYTNICKDIEASPKKAGAK